MTVLPPSVRVERAALAKQKLCLKKELDLITCVYKGGQSFTWQALDDRSWCNIINDHLVILSYNLDFEDDEWVYFECIGEHRDTVRFILRDYFRLSVDLSSLLVQWESRDLTFKRILKPEGVRVLRIDPWECLLSFICSQNNAIYRITNMVMSLKTIFGRVMYTIIAQDGSSVDLYSFPEIAVFSAMQDQHLEQVLRKHGFGYRAKYFGPVARRVNNHQTLLDLRNQDYETVVEFLVSLPGVGPKVADCVALYSLDQLSAVPIDTHILKVALSHYNITNNGKSMTPAVYKKISKRLREGLGEFAGWAQAVLFVSQLAVFKLQG